jgi:hypothetical protein
LIGPYKIYSDSQQGPDYASDSQMKGEAVKRFGKSQKALRDALACEDYDDNGILELTQVKEAI